MGPELAGWISSCLAEIPGRQAVVLFGGTGRVPRKFKAQGRDVVVHDICRSHHLFERALLPNGPAGIGADLLVDWLRPRPGAADRFASWAGTAFTEDETCWLASWHQQILESCTDSRQAALGAIVVLRTMGYWLAWNRHALGYKPLPPAAVFRHYVEQVNREVTVGAGLHEAQLGVPGVAPRARGCDILYCYVPPVEGMRAMDWRLAFWERWVLGDPAALLDFDQPGRLGGPFASEEDRAAELGRLLEEMVDARTWGLAFAGDGEEITAAVERLRPIVARHEFTVPHPEGSRSVMMKEGLIVAGKAA